MRIAAPGLLDRGALIAFDLYQRAAPRATGNLPIRIVDIDEASLKELGQWPWPRGIIAKLIDRLREAGASVVGFDIAFAEPDRTSPRMLVPLLAQNGLPAEEIGRLLASVPDPDDKLAATMRTLPVVTGFILDDRGADRPPPRRRGSPLSATILSAVCHGFQGQSRTSPSSRLPQPETDFSISISIGTTWSGASRSS